MHWLGYLSFDHVLNRMAKQTGCCNNHWLSLHLFIARFYLCAINHVVTNVAVLCDCFLCADHGENRVRKHMYRCDKY